MEPYIYRRPNGDVLDIQGTGEVAVVTVQPIEGDDSATIVIPAGDLGKVFGALREACGLPPAVILDRPDFNGLSTERMDWSPDPNSLLRVSRDRDRLTVRTTMDGGAGVLTPAAGRATAAVLAVLADEAEAEPDPEEVDELAAALMAAHNPSAMGIEGARPFARTALRWMKAKAAGDE
jgi:hypothetical protein